MTKWADRDLKYKLANNLRTRLNAAIRNKAKSGSAVQDLGCTIEELIIHLEKLFLPGMTWENRGRDGWHIDHVIPLSHFDLEKRDQFLQACHYTNLQPLWANENISKGNKIGKTPDYINNSCCSYKRKKKIVIDKNKLSELVKNGLSSYSIAKELNCSPTKIRYWISKLKLKTKHKCNSKVYLCKCGETNKDNFYDNKKSICKKCTNKLSYHFQKIRRAKK